ncbi:MAG TPA: hypothetical protein VF414_18995, partial [Thermoanaerobaculia bacterium]
MTLVSADSAVPTNLRQHAQARQAAVPSGPDTKLRLLYLCHRVPYPPDKGDKIRAFNEIRSLSRRHRVHLLTLADSEVPDLSPLEQMCERVEVFPVQRTGGYLRAALGLFSSRPLTLAFFDSAELRQRAEELAQSERFDLVVAYSSSMAPYAEP